ncbi:hypothetical protein GNQ08_08110 [Paenibacillus macerans]|uniref:Uncharacterized protein n=2 Tax=Paenibacillus TaxID=44249 RepID=A0A6N8EPY8_PAEMA|nr:hypothetical protein [Paenibacillus macerans]
MTWNCLFRRLPACLSKTELTSRKRTPVKIHSRIISKRFGMIVSYGQALLLPSILGIVASMLFFMERDNDTLKNLRTIPVSATRMVTAKILVLFILGLIFSLASVAASMLGGALAGNIHGVFAKLWNNFSLLFPASITLIPDI